MKVRNMTKDDLEAVRNLALQFLYMDIGETEFSPYVVQHPIFESASTIIQTTSGHKPVNLLEDPGALDEVRKQYQMRINVAKDVSNIYMIIRKSYRLTFLKYSEEYLSPATHAKLLADAWVSSENPNGDVNVPLRLLVKWFRKAPKKELMVAEDYKIYQSLPDRFTVYRGVAVGRNPKGLSWTQNYITAKWFANRFNQFSKSNEKGYIQTAEVNKRDVLAYFNTRNEDEVVIDSSKLNIHVLKTS